MPDAQNGLVRLHHLLCPAEDACWRWDADGQTLQWADGTTIAFRAEVFQLLSASAPSGWPSFGALVLLLAACRGSWAEQADRHLVRAKELAGEAARHEPVVLLWFARAVRGLGAVAALPAERRTTTAAKATLVARLCTASRPRWLPSETAGLVMALAHLDGAPRDAFAARRQPWWPDLRGELYALATGLAGLEAEALELHERTGTEVLPEPATLPPVAPEPGQVRRLLLELADDPECGGVARVARDLLAATQVPRRLDESDGLATGGYSDIGNRGRPDRLLLGELANDDLVLAVRLALNEALYLRREVPPHHPPQARHLLLDCGIRLWGEGRLLATAAALALAANADGGGHGAPQQVRAWCVTAHGIAAADLGSRAGLVDLLGGLSPLAHPGAALAPWLAEGAADDERIVITHPRALADPGFRAAWAAAGRPALLAATVDGDGAFRLVALGEPGDRTLATAQLDRARLVVPPRPADGQPRKPVPARDDGPDIDRRPPFPLRVPHPCPPERTWDVGVHGLVGVLDDGRCLWWDDPRRGPRELHHDLPDGMPLLVHAVEQRFLVVLSGRPANRLTLVVLDHQGGLTRVVLREAAEALAACENNGAILVLYAGQVQAYGFAGELLAETRLPPSHTWLRARFLRCGSFTVHAYWDGRDVRFSDMGTDASDVAFAFDRPGTDGPWCLKTNGTLYDDLRNGPDFNVPPAYCWAADERPPRWHVAGVSRDGQRLAFAQRDHRQPAILDLAEDPARRRGIDAARRMALEPRMAAAGHRAQGLLKRVREVARHDDGLLLLTANAAFAFTIERGLLRLRQVSPSPSPRMTLEAVGTRSRPRWRGQTDDVTVEVDMRGVLHLRAHGPHTRDLPQVALVLASQPAMWTNAGGCSGPVELFLFDDAAGGQTRAHSHYALLRRYAELLP